MSSLGLCVCRQCGRPYAPDPRNAYHQEYCTRPACVRKRKRVRQRLWHRERYADDASFRERAKQRVCRHRQRLARACAQGPPAAVAEARLGRLEHALLGLAAQMAGESEEGRAGELVRSWADTGRRRLAELAGGP